MDEVDTPEHTLSHCSRWQAERRQLIGEIDGAPPLSQSATPELETGDGAAAAGNNPVLALAPMIVRGDVEGMDLDMADPVRRDEAVTLEHMIAAMLVSREAWLAVVGFAEAVMAAKEAEERERQAQAQLLEMPSSRRGPPPDPIPPIRRTRRGRPPRIAEDDEEADDANGDDDDNGE